ncbi:MULTISPECIES: transcriptional regulator [unclassified Streptomyces]|uniref:transcriptional regulator n=1 Tax=Streptomyces TaxID=1883 RepID=UPI0021D86EFF|nr:MULTISPECIES: transcriptional regulator [unclassified Streptomyces]
MDRRGFLTAATTTTASVLAQWATAPNSTASTTSGQRIGTRAADLIDSRLSALRHLDDELGGGRVLDAALTEQRMIKGLLKEKTFNETTGRRLFAAASEASRLAGWCAYDSNYIAAAEGHFATALRASASSGDAAPGLIATAFWANTRYACAQPDPHSALDMLDAALSTAGRAGTPRTITLLHIRRARAHSVAGQPTAAYRAIDSALATYQRAEPPAADLPALYWVNEGEIYEAAASSALDLGDPARALSYFGNAASTSDPYDPEREPRGAAIYQARIASAHLALGSLDAALDAAHRVIALMGGVDSTRGSTTVTELRRALARHRSAPSVASFLDATAT